MTFTLLVAGFESADLALKLKVLTGASLSAVRVTGCCVCRIKAHSREMLNWNVHGVLQGFHFIHEHCS